ncbi:cation transporting ATPase C-terminal domain-containing protein, partial [Bradyrhizobium japonicum]|uniref:cation transporting ATPase C-terminal domain-containing protein n=1 Tax=Bradyrhizobium japonicum TaxID=375 RepID=UPI002FFA8915
QATVRICGASSNILRFTIIMGVVSSLFDVVTFAVLLKLFAADAALFQTGWFVESISTQILVIFVIRSRRMRWRANRPHIILIATSLGALTAGVGLALGSPWHSWRRSLPSPPLTSSRLSSPSV